MTLGQKLKMLLKDNGMTQEDLAERLEVSRQAVGKWVNDKGIPEVGKLVQISNLFGVSTDYLLKEECEEKNAAVEKALPDSGYYVSREMLDGYLLYSRQNVRRIAGGISLFILSNVFGDFAHHSMIMSVLYWFTMIAGVTIIVWHFLQIKQYQEIRNERLTFDEKVFEEFKKQREGRRKKYAVTVIAVLIGMITNAWSPYAPIIILFCCLLVTTCKLLIESRGED